jgi:hypothetical protein
MPAAPATLDSMFSVCYPRIPSWPCRRRRCREQWPFLHMPIESARGHGLAYCAYASSSDPALCMLMG